MTSPNRETEAQQAENQLEHRLHTREKASLTIKKEETINLVATRILNLEHQETEIVETLNPERAKKEISNQERIEMVISNQEALEMATIKASALEAPAPEISNLAAEITTTEISNHVLLKMADQEKLLLEKANVAI
ncbi:hypothetical protein D3C86_702940 [compost metagenome]